MNTATENPVVVVVSALQGVTNALLDCASLAERRDADYARVYDEIAGTATLKVAADIPAGGACADKPCWRETSHGFKYLNKNGTPNGIE